MKQLSSSSSYSLDSTTRSGNLNKVHVRGSHTPPQRRYRYTMLPPLTCLWAHLQYTRDVLNKQLKTLAMKKLLQPPTSKSYKLHSCYRLLVRTTLPLWQLFNKLQIYSPQKNASLSQMECMRVLCNIPQENSCNLTKEALEMPLLVRVCGCLLSWQ